MEKLLNIVDSYVGVLKSIKAGPWSTESNMEIRFTLKGVCVVFKSGTQPP